MAGLQRSRSLVIDWKVHFIDGNVSRSIEALLANEDPGLIRLVSKKAPSEVRASLTKAGEDPDRLPCAGCHRRNAAAANGRGEVSAGRDVSLLVAPTSSGPEGIADDGGI
jgi:hypothetical protein